MDLLVRFYTVRVVTRPFKVSCSSFSQILITEGSDDHRSPPKLGNKPAESVEKKVATHTVDLGPGGVEYEG